MAINNVVPLRFTRVPNDVINADLSDAAFRLHAYLLSLPPDWRIHTAQIRKRFGWGRDKSQAAFRELIERRYIIRSSVRDRGRFATVCYDVFSVPQPDLPEPVFQAPYLRLSPTNDLKGRSMKGVNLSGQCTTILRKA